MTTAGKEPGTAAHQVFISYASEDINSTTSDRQVADQICFALESQGIGCWIAPRDILPGDEWMEAIIDAVDQTKIIVLVFSANTEKSQWVKDEIKLALEEKRTIIPFRIQEVYPQRALRLLKVRCQWMDAFTPPLEKHIENLVKIVSRHLGKTPAMPPKDEEKQPEGVKEVIRGKEIKPKKPLPHKRMLIAVSIIILLFAAVFIISQLVKKKVTTTKNTPTAIVKPVDTADYKSQKQKPPGKTQQKSVEKTPGKKEDVTPPQKAPTKETEKIPQEEPAFIKEVKSKGAQVKQLETGSWEAYYKEYDITMIYIPPGEFMMGQTDEEKKWLIDQIGEKDYNSYYKDETPLHKVYLDGYWIGKYEVTFAQYDRYCNDTKKEKPGDEGWGRENRPVINVSWTEAAAYCQWLSKKIGLQFNLPTEAQWEKSARGNDRRKYPWGNHEPYYNGKWYANYRANDSWEKKGEDGFPYIAPVGSYPLGVSPYGMLDMAGNVWEWCFDRYDRDYYKDLTRENKNKIIKNPIGPESGSNRVIRGGSWYAYARSLRCAYRDDYGPSYRGSYLGFRLRQDIK
jgi:formylglycine-generating enzyme required for sulfatase activity